jgi:ATP adenylyltransferase
VTDAYDRLWSPWRLSYVTGDEPDEGCPFCVLPAKGDDQASLIVHRGQTAYVILNKFPYNPGHLMVVPYRHVDDYVALDQAELHEVAELTQRAMRALRSASGPHAFNAGMNVGGAAGAGIADHLHQHVVPRWGGDTNFMPIVGQTRVLPELLAETYSLLRPAFADQ